MNFSQIQEIVSGEMLCKGQSTTIADLAIDSRKTFQYSSALYIAIKGERNNGHDFIIELYKKGVRSFIVEENIDVTQIQDSNVLKVESSIQALQQIAKAHRHQLSCKIIGITGSNGKTIVKEWLKNLLSDFSLVVASPGSYNSQVGVPLSIWNIRSHHKYAILEAGISRPDEMEKLQVMINPDIGVFTNIGDAHSKGFSSKEQKLQEKAVLFKDCKQIVCEHDSEGFHGLLELYGREKLFTWGTSEKADIRLSQKGTYLTLEYGEKEYGVDLPFSNQSSVQNLLHCLSVLILEGYDVSECNEKVKQLVTLPMRLQIKKGINGCDIIDDTYNFDLEGLRNSLDFLDQNHNRSKKTVILSELEDTGFTSSQISEVLKQQLAGRDISRLLYIGQNGIDFSQINIPSFEIYKNVDTYLSQFNEADYHDETILIKGARKAHLEKITGKLEEQIHGTKLEIDLEALLNNFNQYRARLSSATKWMVMVKAFAYGSGSAEVARLLEYNRVDYLSVAYTDEGVELRRQGIATPIMVLNADSSTFDSLLRYNLEPEIYSVEQLEDFVAYLKSKGAKSNVHIKLDTGMHRLGFSKDEVEDLAVGLESAGDYIIVKTVFSHLAAADDPNEDEFTKGQIATFMKNCKVLNNHGINGFDRHILNSAGIARFPEAQFEMVRLGIGLYGIGIDVEFQKSLSTVNRLFTTVSQVRKIPKGETIGYGRKGVAKENMKIATIAIGYADGFSRAFSNGEGEVYIKGKRVPVIGNVCMDMTMIDVTDMDVHPGDQVEIFGDHITIQELAAKMNTIPYEILTSVSQRVKRVFFSA